MIKTYNIIAEAEKFVRDECQKDSNIYGMTAFDHHFKDVVKYASMLADKT
jgi:hypothetical protein